MEISPPVLQTRCAKLWPWLVLTFCATNVIFLGGKRRAFGVFVAELRFRFNGTVSLAELNWIGNSYSALGYITTTLSGSLILYSGRRFQLFMLIGACFVLLSCITSAYVPNPHWLFLTHTLFHGIGSSLILSVVGLVVNEYFDKQHRYHILATMLVSGGSVASVIFVQMFAALVQYNGWRNALIILGIIYFVMQVASVPFIEKNHRLDDYARRSTCVCCDEYIGGWNRVLIIMWFIDRVMTSIVTYGMLMNLADYVHRREVLLEQSSLLTMLFAGGEAVTYLIGAFVTACTGDLLKHKLRYVLFVSTAAMMVLLFLWEAFASNVYFSRTIAFFSGFCMGPSITFLFPAGEEVTRLPGHLAYPFSLAGMGVGMLVSPLVTGLIADIYEYRNFFAIQGGMMAIKMGALLVAIFVLRCTQLSASYEQFDRHNDSDKEEVDMASNDRES